MTNINAYAKEVSIGGWTRIEMLLAIYDRAIDSLTLASEAAAKDDPTGFAENMLAGQKAILAIHSGLQPDADEVAFNIARLLHFVLNCIESDNFNDALKILKNMRSGFAAIYDEATQLEQAGVIPAVPSSDSYDRIA